MAYFLEAMLVSGSVSVWDYTTHRISMEIIIRASTEMTSFQSAEPYSLQDVDQ